MKKETKESIVKLILSGALIGLILLIGYFILKQLGILDMTREEIQAFIESTGFIAPIVFVAISFLQVTFVPIPSTVSILAGNYIFGPWLAFIYSYIGIMLGAMLAFALGLKKLADAGELDDVAAVLDNTAKQEQTAPKMKPVRIRKDVFDRYFQKNKDKEYVQDVVEVALSEYFRNHPDKVESE